RLGGLKRDVSACPRLAPIQTGRRCTAGDDADRLAGQSLRPRRRHLRGELWPADGPVPGGRAPAAGGPRMSTTPSRWRAVLAILSLRDVPFWQSSRRRRIGRVGAFGCYTYLGVLVVLLALENHFLYPGASRETWFAPPGDLNVRDVELTSASGG